MSLPVTFPPIFDMAKGLKEKKGNPFNVSGNPYSGILDLSLVELTMLQFFPLQSFSIFWNI
jgi:hypothetical protein